MKLGVRGKLFLISSSIILVAILVSGLLLSQSLSDNLSRRVESELIRHARTGKLLIETAPRIDDISATDDLADRLARDTASRITIIAANGTVIGDSDLARDEVAVVENHRDRPEIAQALAEGLGEARRQSTTVGQEMLYVAVALERDTGRYVVRAARPLSEIDATIDNALMLLVVAGLVGLGLALLMSALTSHYLSRTLRALADWAHGVAEGRRLEPAPIASRDELGGLAGSLHKLSEELEHSVAAVAAERDRFEAVLDGMREAVVALDEDRRVVLINRAGALLLGLNGEAGVEPLGRTLLETIRVPELHELVDGTERGEDATAEIDLPGGGKRALVHATRRRSGEYVIVLLDVTELRRLESVRRDFVANVSHELRTPVSVIQANAETLLDGAIDDRVAARKFLETLFRSAQRLSELIADLLDISRIESGKIATDSQPTPLRAALERAAAAIAERAGAKRMSTAVDAPAELQALADPGMLDQALVNLADNAVKYADDGGRIALRARRDGDRMLIEVEDDGPGIEPPHRERLFERFYRVDPGRSREMGGTGLGLAIVKHLVSAMDGEVGVRPAERRGSVFWISLPRVRT